MNMTIGRGASRVAITTCSSASRASLSASTMIRSGARLIQAFSRNTSAGRLATRLKPFSSRPMRAARALGLGDGVVVRLILNGQIGGDDDDSEGFIHAKIHARITPFSIP